MKWSKNEVKNIFRDLVEKCFGRERKFLTRAKIFKKNGGAFFFRAQRERNFLIFGKLRAKLCTSREARAKFFGFSRTPLNIALRGSACIFFFFCGSFRPVVDFPTPGPLTPRGQDLKTLRFHLWEKTFAWDKSYVLGWSKSLILAKRPRTLTKSNRTFMVNLIITVPRCL